MPSYSGSGPERGDHSAHRVQRRLRGKTAENEQQRRELCEVRDPDDILTDLDMPVLSGRAFVIGYRVLPDRQRQARRDDRPRHGQIGSVDGMRSRAIEAVLNGTRSLLPSVTSRAP